MSLTMFYDLLRASGETLYMVFLSCLIAIILGLPLGAFLFLSTEIKKSPLISRLINGFINISRSIPFIILLVALIPFTRLIIGTSIGINAAIIPLSLGAAPFFARLVANVLENLPKDLLEAGFSMGATTWQMFKFILLPEARPALIQAITVTAITLVNYSAMAGTVGGGGLGDLAIRYGYQRFNIFIMCATILILIILVQAIQWLGDKVANHFSH